MNSYYPVPSSPISINKSDQSLSKRQMPEIIAGCPIDKTECYRADNETSFVHCNIMENRARNLRIWRNPRIESRSAITVCRFVCFMVPTIYLLIDHPINYYCQCIGLYFAWRWRCLRKPPALNSPCGSVAQWLGRWTCDWRSRVQIPAAALSSATLDKLFTHIVQRLWCYNLIAQYKSV